LPDANRGRFESEHLGPDKFEALQVEVLPDLVCSFAIGRFTVATGSHGLGQFP
jgi:hypothetical protein